MLKTIHAACAAYLALATFAFAADELALTEAQNRDVNRLIDQGLEDDLAWELLESLTTEIGPRLGGSEAEARARDWGVARLKALGFKNVRIEEFNMPYWARVTEEAEIVAPFAQPLVVSALGQSPASPEGGVTGAIVRFETLLDLEDAPTEGLEGKIAFVDELMTRTQDGSGYGVAVQKRSRAVVAAAKRGAVAVLIRSVGTRSHRLPHTGGSVRGGASLSMLPIAALSAPDADQLARALKRAEEVIVRLNIQIEWKGGMPSGNVIGEIPGKSDEIIVVGGHLDSWDYGTGAIDDGAGVAITVAAAKLVDKLRGRPERTIRVIMWGAEEVGLVGARAYAAAHRETLDRHILAAESDFGADRIYQLDGRFGEEGAAKIKPMADAMRRLGVAPGRLLTTGGGGPDTIPLRDLGVPVASLRQNGWDYFNLHHTADDTLDKVNIEALRQNVAAWAAFIYMASEMEGDFGRLPPIVAED